jgi:hypothetical protein
MGAFECGVMKALEELAIYPNIVAGVSIGAIISSYARRAPSMFFAASRPCLTALSQCAGLQDKRGLTGDLLEGEGWVRKSAAKRAQIHSISDKRFDGLRFGRGTSDRKQRLGYVVFEIDRRKGAFS